MPRNRYALPVWIALPLLTSLLTPGCGRPTAPNVANVPEPINLLLPQQIRLHPFTGTRVFDEDGSRGLEVRVEALDAFGDPGKAFGEWRFELYTFRHGASPRGQQVALWHVPLLDPRPNALHWDNITRTYEFKLHWERRPIPQGQRFVLVAVFQSPFTPRLTAEGVYTATE